MKAATRACFFLSVATWAAACGGQEPNGADAARDMAEKRLELMRQRMLELNAVGPDGKELAFAEKPIQTYTDPVRGIMGASVWILGDQGRPHAVAVVEVYSYVQYELTAGAEPPKSVQARSFRWEPPKDGFEWEPVPTTTPPGGTEFLRKRQIKLIADDFAASEVYRGRTYQLRRSTEPYYKYEDKQNDVLYGAVFAWKHDNNVEILMYIEARQGKEDAPPQWVAGFSRLGSARLNVTYKDQDFWIAPDDFGVTPRDAYYFHSGNKLTPEEQKVFFPN